MRRILTASVVGFLLLPGLSSAQPVAVKKQQLAFAVWEVSTGGQGRFIGYYAIAILDEPSGEFRHWDLASIGKGPCRRTRTGENSTRTKCRFTAGVSGKASESFTMDPLLRTAQLTLVAKNETHRVTWTGDDEGLGLYGAAEGCWSEDDDEPPREGRGGGLSRSAQATGHIFGEHLVPRRFGAVMMSGAMVTHCTRARALAGLRPGESLRITL